MKVIFVGAANPETMRMVHAISRMSSDFSAIGFIDNDPKKKGRDFHGLHIFGGMECLPNILAEDVRFVNLITGSTRDRYLVTRDIVLAGGILTNFIHPSVDLMMTRLGLGNYIQESVIIQAETCVGDNSSIHMGSLIGHESRIGNSVFIAHAVSVSGSCQIGDGTFIGTNATILPRVRIGKWCTIGAGAVVTKDVADYSVVVGNPGRVIRTNAQEFTDGEVLK